MTPNRPVYVALAVALVALVVGFSAIAYTVVSNGDRIGEINESRFENTRDACKARNTQNETLVAFVASVAPALRARAVASFPVEPSCAAYARAKVRE